MKEVRAIMAGTVLRMMVGAGDRVEVGQDLLVLESMKMEIPQAAEVAGVVNEVMVQIGDFVNEGDLLVLIEE